MTDDHFFSDRKAAYYTLGCKLNFSEASSIGRSLQEAGYRTARTGEVADVVVVSTCSVTEVADRKGRQAIHRLARQHPGAQIIVTGCYAQLKPDEVASIPGVSLVLGQNEKGKLLEFLKLKNVESGIRNYPEDDSHAQPIPDSSKVRVSPLWGKEAGEAVFMPSCSQGDRTRWWLKVQDGCDYFCSYCTIPYARGRSRNGSIATLVRQAEEAAAQGAKEIVITGVNIGDFGKTTGESFIDLIRALDGVAGISRYRISSLEPDLLTDEIIDFVARSRAFMPHFHIPLQSGSDEVLRLMRRRYDSALFRQKVQRIKAVMPHAFIGVDVIVGTRGETDEHFRQTYDFLRSLDVTQLHVFSYSERPGTAALKIDGPVPSAEKHRRSELLLALSAEKTHAFYASHIGRTATVLLEHQKRGVPISGFTENYIRVEMAPSPTPLKDNTLVHVRLGDFSADGTALKGKEESEQ
ncbi:MAG: tRNA (N(6)-L-threonylcarbamoyladenosine(37)-C(2))-methylthiotransferase MtaB [Bacteroidaceae bacterium]|nr:tRNA (N(6)-L-threonylcarbamoyladenosine(37)-C(2))-methylthiotransferase MtaB [Bacteroidaceae bacterium]